MGTTDEGMIEMTQDSSQSGGSGDALPEPQATRRLPSDAQTQRQAPAGEPEAEPPGGSGSSGVGWSPGSGRDASGDRPGPGRAWAPRGPLARQPEGRVLGGIATGLGGYLGVDAVLLRLGFAVLALLGLSGVALYLLLWTLLPERPGGESLAERWLRQLAGAPAWVRAGLLVLAGLVTLGALGSSTPAALLVIVVVLAVMASRRTSPQV